MKKVLLACLAIISFSSCLDNTDDGVNSNVQNRIIPIESVTMIKDTFNLGERLIGKVNFKFNPSCEALYDSYYLELKQTDNLEMNEYEGKIARFAQVSLDTQCDETSIKNVNDSIFISVFNSGSYTLKFYSGTKEGTDSAKFIVKKVYVKPSRD